MRVCGRQQASIYRRWWVYLTALAGLVGVGGGPVVTVFLYPKPSAARAHEARSAACDHPFSVAKPCCNRKISSSLKAP